MGYISVPNVVKITERLRAAISSIISRHKQEKKPKRIRKTTTHNTSTNDRLSHHPPSYAYMYGQRIKP